MALRRVRTLRGQWLDPAAKLSLLLRFALASQIAFEDNGIRALAQSFWISGRWRG
jgi:hypothetical protein